MDAYGKGGVPFLADEGSFLSCIPQIGTIVVVTLQTLIMEK